MEEKGLRKGIQQGIILGVLATGILGLTGVYLGVDNEATKYNNFLKQVTSSEKIIKESSLDARGIQERETARKKVSNYSCSDNNLFNLYKVEEKCKQVKKDFSKMSVVWANEKPVKEFDKIYRAIYPKGNEVDLKNNNFKYQEYRDLLDIAMYADGAMKDVLIEKAIDYRSLYEGEYLLAVEDEVGKIAKRVSRGTLTGVEGVAELKKLLLDLEGEPLSPRLDKDIGKLKDKITERIGVLQVG